MRFMLSVVKSVGWIGVLLLLMQSVWAQDDSHLVYDEDVATLEPPPIMGARSAAYSFRKSKYQLATEVYHDYRQTFYADCRFRQYQKRLMPVHSSCGYRTRKNETRARRIEWEHVMPAWVFGHQLQCWQNGGRSECANEHQRFKQMEADMHNLVPTVGELNGDRSNYGFRMIAGEPRAYGGQVNMEIAFSQRAAEPPEEVWGDIARTYFYMRERYKLRLSANEEQLFRAWNNLDPVDDWERLRNERITRLQGNHNPFITHYRKMSGSAADIKVEDAPANTSSDAAYSDDVTDQLYQLMMDNREALPPVLVAILAAIYWFYRKKNPKRKTTRKTTPKTPSKPKPRPKPKPKPEPKSKSKSTKTRSRRKPAAEEKESAPKPKTTRRRTSKRKTRSTRSKSKED